MPISCDLSNPQNFITKIMCYSKVVNIPSSMTVLDELLPISIEMPKRNCRGIWNFMNTGMISHNEILQDMELHEYGCDKPQRDPANVPRLY